MRRKKVLAHTEWLTWEGDDFPRELHSDSIVFYVNEHIFFDSDAEYKSSLARAIQLEGISYSLGEAFKLIDEGQISTAGYKVSQDDPNLYVYCENDDPELYYDATFIEVPFVY
jgi:hypothetical protein